MRTREGIIEIREGDLVLGTDLLTNNNFIGIVKLVPIFIERIHVTVQGLKLWSSRNCHIQSLGGEESILIDKVACIIIGLEFASMTGKVSCQ